MLLSGGPRKNGERGAENDFVRKGGYFRKNSAM